MVSVMTLRKVSLILRYGENDWANGPDNARIANLKRMSAAVQKRQPGAYVFLNIWQLSVKKSS